MNIKNNDGWTWQQISGSHLYTVIVPWSFKVWPGVGRRRLQHHVVDEYCVTPAVFTTLFLCYTWCVCLFIYLISPSVCFEMYDDIGNCYSGNLFALALWYSSSFESINPYRRAPFSIVLSFTENCVTALLISLKLWSPAGRGYIHSSCSTIVDRFSSLGPLFGKCSFQLWACGPFRRNDVLLTTRTNFARSPVTLRA